MSVVFSRNPWNDSTIVLSPCIGVCELDASGRCRGCERTTDEIAAWGDMQDSERVRLMLHELPARAGERCG